LYLHPEEGNLSPLIVVQVLQGYIRAADNICIIRKLMGLSFLSFEVFTQLCEENSGIPKQQHQSAVNFIH
jgi:hypothetical protein